MIFNEYIYRGGARRRCGYTTGSCAAGAAKAAAEMLFSRAPVKTVKILTPKGTELNLDVRGAKIEDEYAVCAVKKDGGDDPDVTDGLLIYARAEKIASGIEIEGGEGVGRVTKAGLDQPVGSAAINSVPRKMIEDAVSGICRACGCGVKITVFVPGGKEIAKRTYNPRMGIEGGISIIGTSGIVEPMSGGAIKGTIRAELNMRRAEGRKYVLLTPGNYGERFIAREMAPALGAAVKCGNFIGDTLDMAADCGFKGALIAGHIGKLVKLGAGIMNTHSEQGDARMEVFISCALKAGADTKTLLKIADCAVSDAALSVLESANITKKTMDILMSRAKYYLDARVRGKIETGAVMFSDRFGILGKTDGADKLIKAVTENG